jgi:hypothetical protein
MAGTVTPIFGTALGVFFPALSTPSPQDLKTVESNNQDMFFIFLLSALTAAETRHSRKIP